jgi:hypothetical protein
MRKLAGEQFFNAFTGGEFGVGIRMFKWVK